MKGHLGKFWNQISVEPDKIILLHRIGKKCYSIRYTGVIIISRRMISEEM